MKDTERRKLTEEELEQVSGGQDLSPEFYEDGRVKDILKPKPIELETAAEIKPLPKIDFRNLQTEKE